MALPSFNPRRYPALCSILGEEIVDPALRSLADEAHDQILLRIIHGVLPAGTELKSTRLAEELGMSRTPVIHALARLISNGLVSQALNHRASVRPGAENWLIDLHLTRQLLEPEAARASAGRLSEEVLADLDTLLEDSRPGKRPDWKVAARWLDQALHLVIAEYCGNLSIREIIRRCWSYKRLSYEAGNDSSAHLSQGWKEHAALLAALASGDADLAASLMTEHLQSAALSKSGERIV